MNKNKIENLLKLPPNERLGYFIRKVSDSEKIWGLFMDGWAMSSDDAGENAIPFWPEMELAELCATDIWAGYSPKSIELDIFLSKWIEGMSKDNILSLIFPTVNNKGIFLPPQKIALLLEEELNQYN